MKDKILVICGPTSTGKTKLALALAKKYDGELVSADSRQVYKGMDIGTGKDIPKNFQFSTSNLEYKNINIGYYTNGKIRLWGYDLVEPFQEFSVGQYIKIARKIIRDIWSRNKLPILVGGTGLYIKGSIEGIPTATVPRNRKLRKSLENINAVELFNVLKGIAPTKAASMNASDKKNPRRLIRAIEVYKYLSKKNSSNKSVSMIRIIDTTTNLLIVGLLTGKKVINQRIEARINERINKNLENEIEKLLASGVSWKDQSMQSIGYRQWKSYFECLKASGQTDCSVDKKLAIEKWLQEEKKYAKRQMTWFKNQKGITWFDITDPTHRQRVEKLVNKWHNKPST